MIHTKFCRGVAQSGSAPGLGPGGRRFESSRPDHLFFKPVVGIAQLVRASGCGSEGRRFEPGYLPHFLVF